MKIDFNVEIVGLNEEEILGGPLIAAEQLCALVIADRGESVDGAKGAFQINALMGRIACAKEPTKVSKDEIKLLQTILDNALENNRASTFLVGRLYGVLEGKPSGCKAMKKEEDAKGEGDS